MHAFNRIGGAAVLLIPSISRCDSNQVENRPLSVQQSELQGFTKRLFPSQDHYFIAPFTSQDNKNSDFIIKYDSSRRNPQWVLEHLNSRTNIVQESRKNIHFFPEPSIKIESFQVFKPVKYFLSSLIQFKSFNFLFYKTVMFRLNQMTSKDQDMIGVMYIIFLLIYVIIFYAIYYIFICLSHYLLFIYRFFDKGHLAPSANHKLSLVMLALIPVKILICPI